MIIPVKDPKHAVEIITSRTLPVELRIPHAVNAESFKAHVRRMLAHRGIHVTLADAKRDNHKGIWVTK